jgi:hypothetical protein
VIFANYSSNSLVGKSTGNVVLLTHLGGGAFGNDPEWITQAIRRALKETSKLDLDVKIVSYGAISEGTSEIVSDLD